MNVLCVSPVVPWPLLSGGRIRTYQLLRHLRQRGISVHLRAVRDEAWTPECDARLAEHCESVRSFPRSAAGVIERLKMPKQERWFHSNALVSHLASELQGSNFDCIQADELFIATALPKNLTAPVVVQHHKLDVEFAQATGSSALDIAKLRRLESALAARHAHHIVCSDEDAQRLAARHPALHTHVVPNGVDTHAFALTPDALRESGRLLFVGSLDYAPNIRAVREFVRDVLPRVQAQRTDARLAIVGARPVSEVHALASKDVSVVGEVADVRTELARASVCVVPLTIGGGSRLKIAEALAAGCPIVSTTIGAEGLPVRDGEHISLADDPDAFAAACLRVLAERPIEQVARGRELAERELTWAQMAERLEATWNSARLARI